MRVQINGTRKSQETRKATRFFSERGIEFDLRDVIEKPLAPREIENITRSIEPEALIDTEAKRYRERGLAHMVYDPLEEIADDPRIIKLPIVRYGSLATVGYVPETWSAWIEESK